MTANQRLSSALRVRWQILLLSLGAVISAIARDRL